MSPRGLGDLGRVRDALAMAAVSEESGTRGELSELLDQVAEFITLRYAVAAKPEEYIAWRKRQGYVWTARDRLESGWTLHDAFPLIVTDARFPGYDHLDEFVRLTFHPVLDLRGGVSRPVALADESRGVVVHHGWLSAGNPTRELLHGELDAAMWHGHSSASACAIWAPPRDLQTMLKEDTLVEYADVGIITEFADGARRPLIQTWIWDPKRSRWYLMYVNQQHVEGVELSAGYY